MPKKKTTSKVDAPKKEDHPAADESKGQKEESLSGPSPISIHLNNARPPEAAAKNDSLQDLIEKNIKWSQVIYEQNRRIKRRLAWMVFGNYLRLFLILAPIILGIIFLPELLDSFFGEYKALFGGTGSGGVNAEMLEQAVKLFGGQ